MLEIYIDGSSLGNPGKIGIGYIMYRNDKAAKKGSFALGVQSNNFAEYMALIFSLTDSLAMGEKKVKVFTDSKLVCEQVNGRFKVKNNNIYALYILTKNLVSKFDNFSIEHIDREDNKEADELARKGSGFLV